jgi:hypothetical protein
MNRSHNTNNFAEATFRVVKDQILNRIEAHNPIALLSFIAFELDEYYTNRLTDFAYGRGLKKDQVLKVLAKKSEYLTKDREKVVQISADSFDVISSDGLTFYMGLCSCVAGCQGRFCKHQYAISVL